MKQFVKALGKEGTCFQFLCESYLSLKENVRNFEKLQQKYLRKIYIIQKSFCLKILFFMFLANFVLVVSQNTPSCSFKYFESSDVIVVKKKSLLKVY